MCCNNNKQTITTARITTATLTMTIIAIITYNNDHSMVNVLVAVNIDFVVVMFEGSLLWLSCIIVVVVILMVIVVVVVVVVVVSLMVIIIVMVALFCCYSMGQCCYGHGFGFR